MPSIVLSPRRRRRVAGMPISITILPMSLRDPSTRSARPTRRRAPHVPPHRAPHPRRQPPHPPAPSAPPARLCTTSWSSPSTRSSRSTSPSRPRSSATTRRRRTASPSAPPRRARSRPPRASRSSPKPGSRRSPTPTPSSSPASPPTCASHPTPSSKPFAPLPSAARAWPRSARARSHSPPPASSTAAAPPPTGATPPTSPGSTRAVHVEPDVLYVDEGTLLTSAGVASGLDLCLHILRTDHGAALASHIARRLVVPPHREGGQAQYVDQPLPTHAGGSLAATRAWALEHLHEPLTVRTLAAHAHVSERTFARRFTAETGVPVLQWLLARRVDAARAALESTVRLDRRDRRHLRLRHRSQPPQALPPPRLHHPNGLPPHLHPLKGTVPFTDCPLGSAGARSPLASYREHASPSTRRVRARPLPRLCPREPQAADLPG